jgi:hypothetical protein
MMSYVIDGVLLLALLLTSLRVGVMYRELKRLRLYQSQYVEVFGETSRAADHIGEAVRHLGKEGRDLLERLGAGIEEGRELAKRLEAAARPAIDAATSEEFGSYSRRGLVNAAAAEADMARFKNEILKFGGDNRRLQDRRDDTAGGTSASVYPQPSREFRMAPSVKTVRAAGGNG